MYNFLSLLLLIISIGDVLSESFVEFDLMNKYYGETEYMKFYDLLAVGPGNFPALKNLYAQGSNNGTSPIQNQLNFISLDLDYIQLFNDPASSSMLDYYVVGIYVKEFHVPSDGTLNTLQLMVFQSDNTTHKLGVGYLDISNNLYPNISIKLVDKKDFNINGNFSLLTDLTHLTINNASGDQFPSSLNFGNQFQNLKLNNNKKQGQITITGNIPNLEVTNNPKLTLIYDFDYCSSQSVPTVNVKNTPWNVPECLKCYNNLNGLINVDTPPGYKCKPSVSNNPVLLPSNNIVVFDGVNYGWGVDIDVNVKLLKPNTKIQIDFSNILDRYNRSFILSHSLDVTMTLEYSNSLIRNISVSQVPNNVNITLEVETSGTTAPSIIPTMLINSNITCSSLEVISNSSSNPQLKTIVCLIPPIRSIETIFIEQGNTKLPYTKMIEFHQSYPNIVGINRGENSTLILEGNFGPINQSNANFSINGELIVPLFINSSLIIVPLPSGHAQNVDLVISVEGFSDSQSFTMEDGCDVFVGPDSCLGSSAPPQLSISYGSLLLLLSALLLSIKLI